MTRTDAPARAIPPLLPIIPLRTTVLFPTGVIGLQVSSERSLRLVEALPESGAVVAIFNHSGEGVSDPELEQLSQIGVVAEVVQVLRLAEDRVQLFLHGLTRVCLEELVSEEPFFVGRVSEAEMATTLRPLEADVLMGRAISAFQTLSQADQRYSEETVDLLEMNVEGGPGLFADLLASHLSIPVEEKHRLVEMLDPAGRVSLLTELIEQEIARVTVEKDIQTQVRVQIEARKREMLLREQLKAIKEALGDETGPSRDAAEFRERIAHLPLDEPSRRQLERECDRLALVSEQSNEYAMQRNYFDTLFSLPWKERTRDDLALARVERHLERRHYGLAEVKERVVEYLAVSKLRGSLGGPILCLAGPPGTGKTSLARSIAEALGRRFTRISLGGVSDESEIRGHRKTYVGAMPGKILSAYAKVGSGNPVILLDEMDKLGSSFRGDPAAALLEVLDPEQNRAFVDHYLRVPFDLSETLFIATANRLDTVPPALRDRLEVLNLPGYTEDEKVEIARRHILPSALERAGLPRRAVQIEREAIRSLARGYTAEAGVRELERRISSICRKVAREWARTTRGRGRQQGRRLRAHHLADYLGPAIRVDEVAARNPEVGLATGLAWTASGGAILFIEAARMPGEGKIEITGQLGDVMRESVQAAYSYVRSRGEALEIPPDRLASSDIHIHFPAGAIPKDGPSAGVAVATCLASLLSERPVRHDVAMSGEITLRGKVLAVGGVKSKVLAADRAGIETVILPKENEKDLDEIPAEVRARRTILFADRIEEVWREALMPILIIREHELGRFHEEDYVREVQRSASERSGRERGGSDRSGRRSARDRSEGR